MFFFMQSRFLHKDILQNPATVLLLIISIVNSLPALQLSTDIVATPALPPPLHCNPAFPDLDNGNSQGNLRDDVLSTVLFCDYEDQSAFSLGPSKEHSIALLVCSS